MLLTSGRFSNELQRARIGWNRYLKKTFADLCTAHFYPVNSVLLCLWELQTVYIWIASSSSYLCSLYDYQICMCFLMRFQSCFTNCYFQIMLWQWPPLDLNCIWYSTLVQDVSPYDKRHKSGYRQVFMSLFIGFLQKYPPCYATVMFWSTMSLSTVSLLAAGLGILDIICQWQSFDVSALQWRHVNTVTSQITRNSGVCSINRSN